MFELNKLVRKNILDLQPYRSARDEFKTREGIFLDANENPYGSLNRYPDPEQKELKKLLSELKNIPAEQIFIGNGSDEAIDLAIRIFCDPGKDRVIICPPTYGMYEVSANINDIETVSIPLTKEGDLDSVRILQTDAKMIFICSPNNPTGICPRNVEVILQEFNGIVFVDEAYIEFSEQASLLESVNRYPNLIVSQTLSKARGLAAARIGTAFASGEIISLFKKIKPPYNISTLNQQAAIKALNDQTMFERNIELISQQKLFVENELQKLSFVKEIYPSQANFLLVEMDNSTEIFQRLIDKKIITRNRSSVIPDTIRITIGTEEENNRLITELKEIAL